MSDTPAEPQAPSGNAPMMRLLNQYLKDLSFESPNAPHSVRPDMPPPQVDVSVDVNARRIADDQYEVELACSAKATRDGDAVFLVETNYAGLFMIQNLPAEQIEPALLVEAPRLLFPFARQIIANSTRDGGFMPLMLEPLDFATMYRMQLSQRQQAAQGDGPAPVGTA
ncbi:protein-export chaperone SecB [Parvularcula sp. LCG005]|uniref:protein-export chaperone SecB n=1 Tax=Parvularcula sp. LCG005 TaxID=3078805 RepID=UPI0029426A7D|nr:protein-export chaperone SecB [Parvularcula sp. LCG005]WOI53271.1 protein-export chaperone SecB [Parvularcula sp. LCG005]